MEIGYPDVVMVFIITSIRSSEELPTFLIRSLYQSFGNGGWDKNPLPYRQVIL